MPVKVPQKNQKKIKSRHLKNFSFKNKSPEKISAQKRNQNFSVGILPRIVALNHVE
jgi:hypothetical protein